MLTKARHETGAGCRCSFSGMPSHPSTVVRKMSRLSLALAECRGPSLAMRPQCGGEAFAGEEHGRFATEKTRRPLSKLCERRLGRHAIELQCSGTVIGLPDSARMTTRTLAGVVSLALRETA